MNAQSPKKHIRGQCNVENQVVEMQNQSNQMKTKTGIAASHSKTMVVRGFASLDPTNAHEMLALF